MSSSWNSWTPSPASQVMSSMSNPKHFNIAFLAKTEKYFKYSFFGKREQVIKDIYNSNLPVGDINLVDAFDALLETQPVTREEFIAWAKTRKAGELAHRVYKREVELKDAMQTGLGPIPF